MPPRTAALGKLPSSPVSLSIHPVVAEADFPDAFRVNMYVRGVGTDRSADEALGDFKVRSPPRWVACLSSDLGALPQSPGCLPPLDALLDALQSPR